MKTIEHEASVVIEGRTWGGFIGSCEYQLKPSEVSKYTKLTDFKSVAGDFESITSAVVYTAVVTTEHEAVRITQ